MEAPVCQQPALDGNGALDRVGGPLKSDEEPIPRVVYLAPGVLEKRTSQLRIEPRAEVAPGRVADGLDQARRTGKVGEHQRFAGTGRPQLGHQHGSQLFSRADLELVIDVAEVIL